MMEEGGSEQNERVSLQARYHMCWLSEGGNHEETLSEDSQIRSNSQDVLLTDKFHTYNQ